MEDEEVEEEDKFNISNYIIILQKSYEIFTLFKYKLYVNICFKTINKAFLLNDI